MLEIDPTTGLTSELVTVNGTSVRDVAAIQDSSFLFVVATRKGKELVRLSLNTLKEERLFLSELQHLTHLSWDGRRQQLLGIAVQQAAVSVVAISWSHARIAPLVALAARVPPIYLSALHGRFEATRRLRLLSTDRDVFLLSHSQSSAQVLVYGVYSHHLVVFPTSDVINLVELAPAPALNMTSRVPSVLGIAGEGDLHIEGVGFGERALPATLVLTRRPAVGEKVLIHSLVFENAFHLNGKLATVTADDGNAYITVLLPNGKEMELLPSNLESRVDHGAIPRLNQSVAVSWVSDTSLSARVQAMPEAKYDMVVNSRDMQSNSLSVAFTVSWLEVSPRFAAPAGDTISVTGLGFSDADTYVCRWHVWNSSSSPVFESRATKLSTQALTCASPPWHRRVPLTSTSTLYCDAFVCEGLLSLAVSSQEHGLLTGPLQHDHRLLRMSPGNLTSLTVVEYPPRPIIAAAEQRYVLAARDVHGFNILSSAKIQVTAEEQHLEASGEDGAQGATGEPVALVGETEVVTVKGVATFSNLRPAHASRPYRLTFTCVSCAPSLIVSASVLVATVPFGVPVRLGIEQQPRETVAGAAFTQPPLVRALDANGNKVLDFLDHIHVQLLTVNASFTDAQLIGVTEVAARAPLGVALFQNLTVHRAGVYQLNFSSPFLKSATSRVFRVREAREDSLYAQFVHLNLTSMQPIGPLQVSVRDAHGNLVPVDYNISATLGFVMHPSGFVMQGKLLGVTEAVAVAGTAHFPSLLIPTARVGYVLQFRHGTLHGQTMAFTVKAGSCVRMSIQRQPEAAFAVQPFMHQPRLVILDLANNTADVSVAVNVSLLRNSSHAGPHGGLQGTLHVLALAGVATFTDLAIVQVTASATLVFRAQSPCGFSTVAEPFQVMASMATQLFIAAQPSEGRGGHPFSVWIHLLDAGGNLVESDSAAINIRVALKTIHAGGVGDNSSDSVSATLTGAAEVTSVKGLAKFKDLAIDAPGSYQLEFSSAVLPSVTSNIILVTVGQASYLELAYPLCAPGQPGCFGGVRLDPRVCVRDKGGNLVSGSGITIAANLTTSPDGRAAQEPLSGDVLSGPLSDSCFTFSNLRVDKAAGPYVLQFSVLPPAPVSRRFVQMSCISKQASGPACQVLLPVVPASQASEMQVSVRVANSDFADPDEYVSGVWIGNERIGSHFLVSDGQDNNCAKMSLILDRIFVPWGSLSEAGQLRVRVETSAKVGGVQCYNASTLNAEISVSWLPQSVWHAFSAPIIIRVGNPAAIGFVTRPSNSVATRAFSPQVSVELLDLGGNRVVENHGAYEVEVTQAAAGGQRMIGQTVEVFVEGLAVFSHLALTLRKDNQTLTFTAYLPGSAPNNVTIGFGTVLATMKSAPFSVQAGPAVSMVLKQNPGDGVGGDQLSVQPVVWFVDAGGNLAANVSGIVSAVLQADSPAHLYGNRFAQVNDSWAIFTDLVVDAAATGYALVFSFSDLTDIVSPSFNVSAGNAFRLSTKMHSSDAALDPSKLPRSVLITLHVSLTLPCP